MDLNEAGRRAKVLAEDLQTLAVTGIVLLQQEEPLTFEQWKALFQKAQQVFLESNYSAITANLYEAIMERGVKEAARLIPAQDVSSEEFEKFCLGYRCNTSDFSQWSCALLEVMTSFELTKNLKIRSKLATLLIEEIAIPLIRPQNRKMGKYLIETITIARFPDDHDAREPFTSYWVSKATN